MKLKILNYWHKELLVISFLLFLNINGQELKKEQIDSIYYAIINKIVLKDTVKSKYREAIINAKKTQQERDTIYFEKLRLHKKSKEDRDSIEVLKSNLLDDYRENRLKSENESRPLTQIVKYKSKENSQKCHLFLKQNNQQLKSKIRKDVERNGKMSKYLGKSKLKNALNNFPVESNLEKSKIDSFIKIINVKSDFGHMFSTPIIIGDKMIFHHLKMSRGSGFSRILVYSINNNKIKSTKVFYNMSLH